VLQIDGEVAQGGNGEIFKFFMPHFRLDLLAIVFNNFLSSRGKIGASAGEGELFGVGQKTNVSSLINFGMKIESDR
jgi:hypothetical protein